MAAPFHCTKDPKRPGYCKETHGEIGLTGAGAIFTPEACLAQINQWAANERAAD